MNNIFTRTAVLLVITLSAAGCVQRAPFLESRIGQSLSMIKAQQIINPEASSNVDPVAGMDARAAKSAQDRYQQSFRAPEPPRNAFTIGIGR